MKTRKFRKVLAALMICIVIVCAYGLAIAETATATTVTVDTNTLATQIVIWLLCGLLTFISGVVIWAAKKYALPWIKNIAGPWLKIHGLSTLAEIAVNYAEAQLGRYNGAEKWALAVSLLEKYGIDVDDESVVAALKAKWEELNLKQILAGVKEALTSSDGIETESGTAEETVAEDASGTDADPFTDTDEPVQLE